MWQLCAFCFRREITIRHFSIQLNVSISTEIVVFSAFEIILCASKALEFQKCTKHFRKTWHISWWFLCRWLYAGSPTERIDCAIGSTFNNLQCRSHVASYVRSYAYASDATPCAPGVLMYTHTNTQWTALAMAWQFVSCLEITISYCTNASNARQILPKKEKTV